jgi:type I restriction enzyme R subunit
MRSAHATLQSQQVLVAGMLRPAHLLDLVRNFTVFQQVDGKTRKVVARYQRFRAIHKAVVRCKEGHCAQGANRDERGGIIWLLQGSGKSLSMVFLVRKMRMTAAEPLQGGAGHRPYRSRRQLRETARLSGETLRPNDYDATLRESPTARTQRIPA